MPKGISQALYMRFSYIVDEHCIIRSAFIPIVNGETCLITGVENTSFYLLGGIVAGLFPISEQVEWPQMQALIRHYTGTLKIEEGELPQTAGYVGPNPDHYLFFSLVKEEIVVQTKKSEAVANVLTTFGLDESFCEREILSLSGGEKMKVALAIAFSVSHPCYVLHGVIPWLDKKGRQHLLKHIRQVTLSGSCVVLLEQEVYPLLEVANRSLRFDGMTTKIKEEDLLAETVIGTAFQRHLQSLAHSFYNPLPPDLGPDQQPTLEFVDVTLYQHPGLSQERLHPLFHSISFRFHQRCIYALVGDNGSGKSTLVHMALKIILPDSGTILFRGAPLSSLDRQAISQCICYVGQFPEQQIIHGTIEELRMKLERQEQALALGFLSKWLPLSDETRIFSLSMLEIKLLCLISFITHNTKLIILDEPTWGLDQVGQAQFFKAVEEVCADLRVTLLIVSHDISVLRELNTKVLWIKDGHLHFFESVTELFSDALAQSHLDLPAN
ncbi:MAG: ATP-binding cassette domain-containing protein [Abitibacteriaceae bacterium]|nr:ATP-binding cassette domain-containing protein [Abditibacteriaceae bacterium]